MEMMTTGAGLGPVVVCRVCRMGVPMDGTAGLSWAGLTIPNTRKCDAIVK